MVREGNPGAFEAIVDRYQGRLLGFCRQMLRSTEDAEDILQEVFVNAYKAMIADNREINLRPWLYRIARNRCLNHLRKPTADARESMDMVPITEAASTAETVHNREEFRQLLTDVSKLPETQRTALLLREMDGLSYDEISESMDTTVPSVKSLLVRARMSLSEASEARMLTCGEVRLALAEAAEGLSKVSGPVRRHVRECDECTNYRKQLRSNTKAFAMIFPAGPLMAMKAFLLAKLGGAGTAAGGGAGSAAAGGAAASGGVCATGSAATGAAIAGGTATAGGGAAAVGSGAAAAGAAAVGGGAAATAGLATAAIGGGSAMSSAIGAKALAGVVTAAVITAGAVEVKSGAQPDQDPATAAAAPVAKVAPPTHDIPATPLHRRSEPVIAVSAAEPAKSETELSAAIEETVPVEPVPVEPAPPVTAGAEEEEAADEPAKDDGATHPAGKSDGSAGIGNGKGLPTVPVDPDSIVIVAPSNGSTGPSGPTGATGPSGPTGPTEPETPIMPPPVDPTPAEPAPTPPPPADPAPAPAPVDPPPRPRPVEPPTADEPSTDPPEDGV